jgi:hypothetical protein
MVLNMISELKQERQKLISTIGCVPIALIKSI